jgi:prepilin-type N-terminal cleavage/methylation domain-containing protein
MYTKKELKKGFTLIEIMVSISVFAIVMLVSSGSIFSVFDANRKSQTLRSVMDNLNLSLESMTRTIRFGSVYHCDITQGGALSTTRDCAGGATSIAVLDSAGQQIVYRLDGTRISRSINGGAYQYVTGTDVSINSLNFFVLGSTPYSSGSNIIQPKVIISVTGHAGTKTSSRTDFRLQTMVSQRLFDSQ